MRKNSIIISIKRQEEQCLTAPFEQQRPANFFLGGVFFLLFASFLSAAPVSAIGQRNRPDTIFRKVQLPDSLVEKKLVELASNGLELVSSEHQNKINEYQLKSARTAWLNLLTISTSYNDQSFAKQNTQNTYVYPKFFGGINIPLGTLFSRTSVKAAKEQVEISKINREQLS